MESFVPVKEFVVTPEIAKKAANQMSAVSVFDDMLTLYREVTAMIPYDEKTYGSYAPYAAIITSVFWTAGRLYGVRAERARRKGKD